MREDCYFEQGPIRPPSEAKSLLIRATRNCPWNKCAFCHTYHDTKFELRTVEDTLLGIIDNYFSLSDEERLIYRVGRRSGLYGRLADLSDKGMYDRVKSIIDRYKVESHDQLDNDLLKIMNRYIQ